MMAHYGNGYGDRGRAEFHYWDHYEAPLPVRRYGADFRRPPPGGYGGDFRRASPRGYGVDFGRWGGAGRRGGGRDSADGRGGRGYYEEHGSTQWGPDRDFGNYNMDRGFRNLYPYRQYDRGWNTGW